MGWKSPVGVPAWTRRASRTTTSRGQGRCREAGSGGSRRQEVRGDEQKPHKGGLGRETSQHKMAKSHGTASRVDVALVHRQFTFLPGEICTTGGGQGVSKFPDGMTPGHQRPSAARAATCMSKKKAAAHNVLTARQVETSGVMVQKSAEAIVVNRSLTRAKGMKGRTHERRDSRKLVAW